MIFYDNTKNKTYYFVDAASSVYFIILLLKKSLNIRYIYLILSLKAVFKIRLSSIKVTAIVIKDKSSFFVDYIDLFHHANTKINILPSDGVTSENIHFLCSRSEIKMIIIKKLDHFSFYFMLKLQL